MYNIKILVKYINGREYEKDTNIFYYVFINIRM